MWSNLSIRNFVCLYILMMCSMTTVTAIKFRIIGGVNATQHETRHQVSLRLAFEDGKHFGSGFYCGGTLIGPNAVLTAAHCLFDRHQRQYSEKELHVVMGTLFLDTVTNETIVAAVTAIHVHMGYDPITLEHDIAILHLNESVPHLVLRTNGNMNTTDIDENDDLIAPITLSTKDIPVDSVCQVTGWGVTRIRGPASNVLLTANVTVIPTDKCSSLTSYGNKIRDGMICAGSWEGGIDSCSGDSGGPLVCNDVLVGIVSFGQSCAKPNFPGVYTDVHFHRHWILEHLPETDSDITNGSAATKSGLVIIASFIFFQLIVLLS